MARTDDGPTLPRRWRAIALAAPSLVFVLALVGGEAAARLLLPPLAPLEVFVRDPHQRMGFTDRRQVRIFRFDPELFWRLEARIQEVVWDFTLVSTNAQGLRHPRALSAKPPGGVRILCVGDSVTFGYRVPVVWAERPASYDRDAAPYPRLLERRLRAANPDRMIEVVPLAVPGYSSYQGRLWLARQIEQLEPDLVVALFGWNDVNVRPAADSEVMPAEAWRVALRSTLAASQALLRVTEALAQRPPAERARDTPLTLRVTQREHVDNHLEMARLAEAAGAGFAAIGAIYRDGVGNPGESARLAGHRRALREAFANRGLPFLEIPELTEAGHPANTGLFGEAIHPNDQGHRLLADRLARFLAGQNLLPGLAIEPTATVGLGDSARPGE